MDGEDECHRIGEGVDLLSWKAFVSRPRFHHQSDRPLGRIGRGLDMDSFQTSKERPVQPSPSG